MLRYRAVKRADTEDGLYGPSGRRTRASLTRKRPPAREPEAVAEDLDEPRLPPILRKVNAHYELTEREKPREQVARDWRRPSPRDLSR